MNAFLREYLFSPRSTCMGCGSVRGTDQAYLCADCYASLNPLAISGLSIGAICANCGEEYVAGQCKVCGKRKVETIKTAAAYEYEGPIRNLVHEFKFSGVWRMSGWMAAQMLDACRDGFLNGVTLVTSVPMHPVRKMMRGYNQSEKLASEFSKITKIPYRDVLKRVRNTRQQSKLDMDRRRHNLTNAFKSKGDLEKERILLIDDVRTTGTTAVECAKVLLSNGAKEVRVLTFAKAANNEKKHTKKRKRGSKSTAIGR